MQTLALGSTGIAVPRLAFGAGPVSGAMTGVDCSRRQALIEHAIQSGILWFDTAATYGEGQSEKSLGAAFSSLGSASKVLVATKVRLMPEQLGNISEYVRRSVAESLGRLRIDQITLLQIHNAITVQRGDEPTSITPEDIFDPGGVLEVMQHLREEGLVRHLGITAIGHAPVLRQVVASGQFDTIQVPYNLTNPSAGQPLPNSFWKTNYGNIIQECARQQMGVFAIRVFAAGALADNPPSAHTQKTKFFPLDLYQQDRKQAANLKKLLPNGMTLKEASVRFVLSHPYLSSAIIGFGKPAHIDEAISYLESGPLPLELINKLIRFA